jgi:hypothetical protein
MATPDYLQQVIVSGRKSTIRGSREQSASVGIFRRPSMTSLIWASLDLLTVLVAGILALRMHVAIPSQISASFVLFRLFHVSVHALVLYLLWYALCLIFFSRSYGLYGPVQTRSGLHEQRMTMQASLTAGLVLCGTLYLSNGAGVSRTVVMLTVVFSTVLLCMRRAIQRRSFYRRSLAGIETRNVLIVGAGRVAHALRNHLESLQHLGFRFKGFVALTEREAELGDTDVIGDVRNCLSLARSLFVDEIFFSVPGDKKLIISIVEEARQAGIDVRVVPDLYDGLAWNAPVEYVGQFPTIPLHRREFPIGAFLLKRVLDITLSSIALAVLSPIMFAWIPRAQSSIGPTGSVARAVPFPAISSGRWFRMRTS